MRALQISKYDCQKINDITEDCVAQEPGKWVDFNCTTYIQIGKLPKATKSRPPLWKKVLNKRKATMQNQLHTYRATGETDHGLIVNYETNVYSVYLATSAGIPNRHFYSIKLCDAVSHRVTDKNITALYYGTLYEAATLFFNFFCRLQSVLIFSILAPLRFIVIPLLFLFSILIISYFQVSFNCKVTLYEDKETQNID